MTKLLQPLIKNKSVIDSSVFDTDFPKNWGKTDKVLMLPGADWYALSILQDTIGLPAGQVTAENPLAWGKSKTVTDRTDWGRPLDHLSPRCGRSENVGCQLRELGDH